MSKKPSTASALAGILNAKRGGDSVIESPTPDVSAAGEPVAAPTSPALPAPPSPVAIKPPVSSKKARIGKSKDTANYSQFSVYLRKDTRKKAGRVLEDTNPDMDFSDLVQELLEKWLTART